MWYVLAAALVLVTPACGSSTSLGSFESYAYQFQLEGKIRNQDVDLGGLTIRFANLKPPHAALCYADRVIEVDQDTWEHATQTTREVILYHEFGHCLLLRRHRPNSIMQASLLNPNKFQVARAEYLDELFKEKD